MGLHYCRYGITVGVLCDSFIEDLENFVPPDNFELYSFSLLNKNVFNQITVKISRSKNAQEFHVNEG